MQRRIKGSDDNHAYNWNAIYVIQFVMVIPKILQSD